MKMIIRMFCAVALVAGALSLTACSKDEAKPAKDNSNGTQKVQTTTKPGTNQAPKTQPNT